MLQGCCLQKPTKYDVNRNSSELFLPDKPVDQVQCYTLKLAKTLSGASIVVIAGEHRAQTNKQTESGQTDRRTDGQTERRTNKHFRAAFPSAAAAVASLFNGSDLCRLATIWGTAAARHCCCIPSTAAAAAKLLLGVRLWQKLQTSRGREQRSLFDGNLFIKWGQNWI